MGVQKNKRSKSRTRKKRSAWAAKLGAPSKMACPQCHQPKMPHRVCPSCGYYKNREVIKVAAE